MKQTLNKFAHLLCLALAWSPCLAHAASAPVLTTTAENDLYGVDNLDRHYTQGLKFTLLAGSDTFTNLAARLNRGLPAVGLEIEASRFGWVILGQNIYTPDDLSLNPPDPTDRPYAGWLYTGLLFQRTGLTGGVVPTMESFEINLGIIGKTSLAEFGQKTVHRWDEASIFPQGWDSQLGDEPGLVLKYARLWRLSVNAESSRYVDVVPHVGAAAGNVLTAVGVGATVRAGYNLPADFGVTINDSFSSSSAGFSPATTPWHVYLFGGVDGRAVAQNLFLDGNSFRGGPSVTKEPFVADLTYGIVVGVGSSFSISYTQVVRTEEFRGQRGRDHFASVTAEMHLNF